MSLKNNIFFIITLFHIINCGLVFENVPLYIIEQQMRNEIRKIEALHPISFINFPKYETKLSDGTTISFSEFKLFSNIVDENLFNFTVDKESSTLKLISNNITDYYPLNCLMNCLLTVDKTSYNISFSFYATFYELSKNYKKASEGFYQDIGQITSNFDFNKIENNLSKIDDSELNKILAEWFKKNVQTIIDAENLYGSYAYYYSLDFLKLLPKLSTNTFKFSNDHILDLTNEENPRFEDSSILLTKYGKIDNNEDKINCSYPGDLTKYQLIFHRKIFENLFTNGLFGFTLTNSSNPSNKFNFQLLYLKKVFDLPSTLQDDTLFTVRNVMENITFENDIKDGFNGILNINSDFVDEETKEVLVSIVVDVKFSFKNEIFQNGFNLALFGKNANVNKLTVNPEPVRKITDENLLKDWINDMIIRGLGKSQFNLLENPLDLSIFFKRNNKVSLEIKDNTFLIFNGKPRA